MNDIEDLADERSGCVQVLTVLSVGLLGVIMIAVLAVAMDPSIGPNLEAWFGVRQEQQNQVPGQGNNTPAPSAIPTVVGSPIVAGSPPVISARTFVSGSAPRNVSGAFSLDSSVALDAVRGASDGERTDIYYGTDDSLEEAAGLIQIRISSIEDGGYGLNIYHGPWTATYMGEGCTWQVDVTQTVVSGHVSCAGVPAINDDDGSTGSVSVELDFTANSP